MRNLILIFLLLNVLSANAQIQNYDPNLVGDDWLLNVNTGNVTNVSTAYKFGRNETINTGSVPEDIWEGGGLYTGFPVSDVETIEVFSSNSNDNAIGTGAMAIAVFGLDANWEMQSDTIVLNGTTSVFTTNTYRRVNRVKVLTAGSSGHNEGSITVRHSTTTSNMFAVVPATYNQTTIAAYTIPSGYTGYIKHINCQLQRGSTGSATVHFVTRPQGGVFNVRKEFTVSVNSDLDTDLTAFIKVYEKTDIKMKVVEVASNGTNVSGEFHLFLVKNS